MGRASHAMLGERKRPPQTMIMEAEVVGNANGA